jgi:glycosyltransferase involved in cell wall biosynthesis
MRICIDARPIINKQTGLGRYTYNIINALKQVDCQNDYLILVDAQLSPTHPVFHGNNERFVYKKCPIPGVTVQQQLQLRRFLATETIDVYHYPHFDLPIAVARKFPSVFTVHDLTYLLHRGVFRGAEFLKKWYTQQIMRLGIGTAQKIITVSDSTKQDLVDYFKLNGAASSKVTTIYEACEPHLVRIADKQRLQNFKQKWQLTRPYFLFIGERRPHKNLVRQIEAFDQFLKQVGQEFEFIIIGKSYNNYFEPEAKTQELALTGRVRFLGYVDDEEIPLFYSGATAFLFASLYEGFGIPILEAMACGTPVITSNISSCQEIAGDAALLVNPYQVVEIVQAMTRIATELDLRASLIQKGLQRKSDFSWEIAAQKTLNLYQQLR